MIKASKAREIASRANFNLFDEQIRTIFECIEYESKEGNFSFSFTNNNCIYFGLDHGFWFTGAMMNDSNWEKTNTILKDNGYVVSYVVNTHNLYTISIFW